MVHRRADRPRSIPRFDQLDARHVTIYKADVIKTFADKRTRDLYVTGRARRLPADLATRAARKLEYVDLARRLDDLRGPARQPASRAGRGSEGATCDRGQ